MRATASYPTGGGAVCDGPGGRRVLPGSRMNPARDHLKAYGVPILVNPFGTPFGPTFVFQDPDRDPLAIHGGS